MEVSIPKGTYIVAVSGGVDSVALLHMLVSKNQEPRTNNYIVAHFDHGIRPDSHKDATLVKDVAEKYGIAFECERVELGPNVSEDAARTKRYAFLRNIQHKYNADAILTAHHQDDLIETIAMHVLRGTGRQGLSPMQSHADIRRPLLNVSKADIVHYAKENNLLWREDSTNDSDKYLRNVIRKELQANMTEHDRNTITRLNKDAVIRNAEIDALLANVYMYVQVSNELIRTRYVILPFEVAAEIMMLWLKHNDVYDFDRKKVGALVIATKTLLIGKKIDINKTHYLLSEKTSIKILRK